MSAVTVGTITYRTMPAATAGGDIPRELEGLARWYVVARPADGREIVAGWITADPGHRNGGEHRRGRGRWSCFLGGDVGAMPCGPALTYLGNVRRAKGRGLSLVAGNHAARLAGHTPPVTFRSRRRRARTPR